MFKEVPRRVITLDTHRHTPSVMRVLLANVVCASEGLSGMLLGSPSSGRGELSAYAGHEKSFPVLAGYLTRLLDHTDYARIISNILVVEYAIYDSHLCIHLQCDAGEEGNRYTEHVVLNFPTKIYSAEANL